MKSQEIIKMLQSIKKDADKIHSGNAAHQRTHIIADVQWLIDELSKANEASTKETPALPIESVSGIALSDHGICKEKSCDKPATKDYNGHGHWVCDSCYDSLNRYFDEEYR